MHLNYQYCGDTTCFELVIADCFLTMTASAQFNREARYLEMLPFNVDNVEHIRVLVADEGEIDAKTKAAVSEALAGLGTQIDAMRGAIERQLAFVSRIVLDDTVDRDWFFRTPATQAVRKLDGYLAAVTKRIGFSQLLLHAHGPPQPGAAKTITTYMDEIDSIKAEMKDEIDAIVDDIDDRPYVPVDVEHEEQQEDDDDDEEESSDSDDEEDDEPPRKLARTDRMVRHVKFAPSPTGASV